MWRHGDGGFKRKQARWQWRQDWNDPPARISSNIKSWKRQAGAGGCSPRVWGQSHCWHLGFGILTSRSVSERISVGFSHRGGRTLSQQPQARNMGIEKQPGTDAGCFTGEASCDCPSDLNGEAGAKQGCLRFHSVLGWPRMCVFSALGPSAPAWTPSPTNA